MAMEAPLFVRLAERTAALPLADEGRLADAGQLDDLRVKSGGHFTLRAERRSVTAARFSKRCKVKKLQSYNFTTL